MSIQDAVIAVNRFGLGARPGELSRVAGDPRGWLKAQLGQSAPPVREFASLRPSGATVMSFMSMKQDGGERDERKQLQRQTFADEMTARCLVASRTELPFRERLVRFWSNHLAVSTTRNDVRPLAGAYEREAIRPFVCGRYEQMLLASARHPAMLVYLDNVRSIGPRSAVGARRRRGLNENYARELLELHTLGVRGGYTQRDIEELARILTGWGMDRRDGIDGAFHFAEGRHEPGTKTVLGKRYREGEASGRQVIVDLARHPSTATFLATKLARHFIADDPPAAAVERIAEVYRASGGDLGQTSAALVDSVEAWEPERRKLKTPADLVTSTARALGYDTSGEQILKSLRYLGQEPFHALSPQGWSDRAEDWIGPEAILTRVEWAERVGSESTSRVAEPLTWAEEVLGHLSPETRSVLAGATSGEVLALLLASPEFQRR